MICPDCGDLRHMGDCTSIRCGRCGQSMPDVSAAEGCKDYWCPCQWEQSEPKPKPSAERIHLERGYRTMTHTPGPLHVSSESSDGVFGILTESGHSIGCAYNEEDARLWAGASNMLAALEAIEGGSFAGAGTLAIAGDWQAMFNCLQAIARAAIAKAQS